jgi:hypothetical protein
MVRSLASQNMVILKKITSIKGVQHPFPLPLQWRENHLNTFEEVGGDKENKEQEKVENQHEIEEESCSRTTALQTPNNDCRSSQDRNKYL